MKEENLKKLIRTIQEKSVRHARFENEDFNVDDYAGGNIDDAYDMGCDDGEITFARELLKIMGS